MDRGVAVKKHEGEKRTRARRQPVSNAGNGGFGLKNMRLGTKLALVSGILVLVSIIMLVVSMNRMAALQQKVEYNAGIGEKLALTQEMSSDMTDIIRIEKNFIIEYDAANNAGWIQKRDDKYKDLKEKIEKIRGISGEGSKKAWGEFGAKLDTYFDGVKKVFTLCAELDTNTITSSSTTPEVMKMRADFMKAIRVSMDENKKLIGDMEPILEKQVNHYKDQLKQAKEESAAAYAATKYIVYLTSIVGIFAGVLLAFIIVRTIRKSVENTVNVVKEIASGDFTRDVPVDGNDEIAELGIAVNEMVGELRGIFTGLGNNSKSLATSSEELSAVSTQLSASSEEMSQQAAGVASATEQMSSNINSMATAVEEASMNATTVSGTAEQMSANMHAIASSVEEMSQSIREVAKSADETSKVAGEAMDMSRSASNTMQTLGAAANEIGKVTEMIKRIAEQTNLLALNATIEAASAGEAGRGFAVVANEIKELANQSARAAEEIAAKIEGVRGSATSAVKVISDVSDIIGKINTSVGTITGAVNQQTAAANEISRNVSEVSKGAVDIASSIAEVAKGATEISRNSGEAARGANEVSSNIQGISKAVLDNNAGITQINSSSGELAKMASSMQAMISRFKVGNNGNGNRPNANVVAARERY